MKCMLCDREFNSLKSLGLHLTHTHKNISHKEYYDQYMKTENDGICPVCGKPTKWKGGLHGYARTCSISCGQKHPETRKRMTSTNQERYGADNPYGSKVIREKIKQTNLDKYGVENTFCLPGVNKKAIEHSHSKEAENKRQQTCLEKYGNKFHIASKEIRDKAINTYQEKYGVSNAYSIPHIHEKALQNSLAAYNENGNHSSWETLLENAFIEHNIKYKKHYNKDNRYPYHCDFYLPKIDTFIEINGFWTHGGHWFDEDNLEDIKTLKIWKNKNDKIYKNAIKTWTIEDLNKLKCAIKNNLNYIVLWTLEDIKNYITTL